MKILDVPQSGSVAGTTSSRNRFGQYRRTRAVPVNPNTTAQTDMRMALTDLSQSWKTLTDAQRDAWNSWAQAHPRVDSLGQVVVLSGLQAFVGSSSVLMMLAQPPAMDAPAIADMIAPPVISMDTVDLGDASVLFAPDPIPAGQALALYCSPPRSPGVSFNRDFRYLVSIPAAATGAEDIHTQLAAKWGTLAYGQTFFMRAKLVRLADGLVSGLSPVLRWTLAP